MQDFFVKLFRYHIEVNLQLITIFKENHHLYTKEVKSLFSHNINAHQIWNARINRDKTVGVWEVYDLKHLESLITKHTKHSLVILDTQSLQSKITYTNLEGQNFESKLEDILFHIINHTTHHRAQIMTLLRMNGQVPPKTDFIYKAQNY